MNYREYTEEENSKKIKNTVLCIIVMIMLFYIYMNLQNSQLTTTIYKVPMMNKYKPMTYNMVYRPHHFVNRDTLLQYKLKGC